MAKVRLEPFQEQPFGTADPEVAKLRQSPQKRLQSSHLTSALKVMSLRQAHCRGQRKAPCRRRHKVRRRCPQATPQRPVSSSRCRILLGGFRLRLLRQHLPTPLLQQPPNRDCSKRPPTLQLSLRHPANSQLRLQRNAEGVLTLSAIPRCVQKPQ